MDSIKLPSDLFKCCQIGASVITPVPGLNCGNACGVCVCCVCMCVCIKRKESEQLVSSVSSSLADWRLID